MIGRHVAFEDPLTGKPTTAHPLGQQIFPIALEEIARDVERLLPSLTKRTRNEYGRIEQKRAVLHNMPFIMGTRIPTRAIWEFREAGYGTQAILKEFPRLTRRDVKQAIEFEERREVQRASA